MKVGINGFGRIGKNIFKILLYRNVEVTQINDPNLTPEYLEYLLKYDSTYDQYHDCTLTENKLIYKKGIITELLNKKDPAEIPWDVDIVIEASGVFTTLEQCKAHKVGKVLITAPSKDAPMFVYGVNHMNYAEENIVSGASCTTNCLAPIVKILNDAFTIKEGFMTTVHAVTSTQKAVDGQSAKDWRCGRGALQNIIPTSTGAAEAVAKIIPELKGKITGLAMRVPVANVSVVDFTFKTEKETSMYHIVDVIQDQMATNFRGIVGITKDKVVSSDFNGCPFSTVVDVSASIELNSTFFKLIAWYDNEYGYSCRTVDLLEYIMKLK